MAIKEVIKNKTYKIEVVIGYNGNRRIRHYETFHGGLKDARLREAEIKASIKNGTHILKKKITFGELLDEWLESLTNKGSDISPKTLITYMQRVQVIKASIGHITLQNLNVKVLEEFYNKLRNEYISDKTHKALSERTLRHYYILINTAIEKARIWGYINVNPNSRIEKPKARAKEVECYSPEEVEQLLLVLKNEPLKYQSLIMLALDSGARRGEITGLTWDDVDFEKGTIKINKTTQYTKELGIFEKATKTKTSDRELYITQATIKVLKKYKLEQNEKQLLLGDKWENSKRVFTTEYGGDMHPDTPSQIFEKIIQKYELKRIKFHALRHTSISLLIQKGIQPQIISRRAGHSSVTTTDTIYSHFFDEEARKSANVLDDIMAING